MPQLNSASAADHRVVRKRNRVPLSCNFCRQRKLKCNRGHPCENCIKRGEANGCVYLVGSNSQLTPHNSNGERKLNSTELQKRLDKLENLVLGLMTMPKSESPHDSSSSEQGKSELDFDVNDVDSVRHSLGLMKLDRQGTSVYHGETHWAALMNELTEMRALFDDNCPIIISNPLEVQKTGEQQCISSMPEPSIASGFPFSNFKFDLKVVLSELPSRPQCDILVRRYFEFFDPIFHILHRATFENEYAAFWSSPEQTGISWIAMFLAMLTVSVQSYEPGTSPQPFTNVEKETWTNLQAATEACLVEAKYMSKGNITLSRAHFIWIMSETRNSSVNILNRTSVALGGLVRSSMVMGLHRDPKWYSIAPFESETRRRVWHCISALDTIISINDGLPLNIKEGDDDVRLPLNILDSDIYNEIESYPRELRHEMETSCSYLICLAKLTKVIRKVMSLMYSYHIKPTYDDILAIDAELRATYGAFPEYLTRAPELSLITDSPQLVMHRFLLDAQFKRALIILHKSFSSKVNVDSKYVSSRNECLELCLEMIRRHNWLHTSAIGKRTLELFTFFVDGIFNNQFLHASILLCIELYNSADTLAPNQIASIQEAIEAEKQILMANKTDIMAHKRLTFIQNFHMRSTDLMKMTPGQREKFLKSLNSRQNSSQAINNSVRSGLTLQMIFPDAPTDSNQRSPIMTGNNTYEDSNIFLTMSSGNKCSGVNIPFLPEEEEIYIDTPFRLRKIPDPTWLQQIYSPDVQNAIQSPFTYDRSNLVSHSDSISSSSREIKSNSHSTGRSGSTESYTDGSGIPTVSTDRMMMTSLTDSSDEGFNPNNWDEWDMFVQGMEMNSGLELPNLNIGGLNPMTGEPTVNFEGQIQSPFDADQNLMDTTNDLVSIQNIDSGATGKFSYDASTGYLNNMEMK
ncbi:fungal-specific transcription factor domain-containing protein [Dipodascopsis uninucleata]